MNEYVGKVKLQAGPGDTLYLPIPDTVLHMLRLRAGDKVKVDVVQGDARAIVITKA